MYYGVIVLKNSKCYIAFFTGEIYLTANYSTNNLITFN